MQNKFFSTIVAIFFIGISVSQAQSALIDVTLQPNDGKDALIQGSDQGQYKNYGDDPTLVMDSSSHANGGLIEFDLSDYQGADIQLASLSVYFISNSGPDDVALGVYQILEPWEEDTVKWANQPDVNTLAIELMTLSGTDGNTFITFDITSLAEDWVNGDEPNYGIYIGLFDGNSPTIPNAHIYSSDFDNSENAAVYDPKLAITMDWTPVPLPGSGLLFFSGLFFLFGYRRKR